MASKVSVVSVAGEAGLPVSTSKDAATAGKELKSSNMACTNAVLFSDIVIANTHENITGADIAKNGRAISSPFRIDRQIQFDGEKDVRELEADVVRGFEKRVQGYATVQLLDGLRRYARPLQTNLTGASWRR